MSEFKGTPGPWRVVRNTFEEYSSTEYCELAIKGHAEGMDLVVAGVVSDCIDEHKANANLIAAAPELFDCLQEVFVIGNRLVADVYGDDFVRKARAALAKALGQ